MQALRVRCWGLIFESVIVIVRLLQSRWGSGVEVAGDHIGENAPTCIKSNWTR